VVFLKFLFIYNSPDPEYRKFFVSTWYKLRDYSVGDEKQGVFQKRWKLIFLSNFQTKVGLTLLFMVLLIVWVFCFWGLRFIVSWFIPIDKLTQEIMTPFFFCLISLFWLSLCLYMKKQNTSNESIDHSKKSRFKIKTIIIVAFFTITVSSVLIPFSTFDFGSITSVFSILLPLIVILVTSQFKKIGLPVIVAFVFVFLLGGFFIYQNLLGLLPGENFLPSFGQDRIIARMLNFKDGSNAQSWAIYTHRQTKGSGLPYQELLNGSEHIWETKAISHEGGWAGVGFGNSPNRNSQVRQDTIQFDSVFSFFIVSEYGLFGGICLLILYSFPLILIFIGGREHFDVGYGFGFILASAFLFEAFYHAGMNFGTFPMSGRNLPLLSVNSPSDLFKWSVIILLLIQAIFWRYRTCLQLTA
jgi:cell division protein FtsW (lipid II flippase)